MNEFEPNTRACHYLSSSGCTHLIPHASVCQRRRNCLGNGRLMTANTQRGNLPMRFQTYRDENHSRHFDLIRDGARPKSIDLVSVMILAMLVVGFGCAIVVPFAWRVASL